VHVLTENFGRTAYLVPKSGRKNAKTGNACFHALSIVDMEVEHLPLRDIHRIKEVKPNVALANILFNPVKSAISLFLTELVGKVVKDVQPNPPLFDYIYHSVCVLELLEKGIANFHLVFMFRLSRYLGFLPDTSGYSDGAYFDLQNGVFTQHKPQHPYFLNPDDSVAFNLLWRMNYENMHLFRLSHQERNEIVRRMLEYYRLHLADLPELKSLDVLQQVFA
jgi:DNA repair protein RecO (recombination protein O)